jgi:3-oxoacyl-[acyl-carrier protein] reductase
MLLQGKKAVIYGAAGAVGQSVATVFAQQGAELFLTGRHLDPLEVLAGRIRSQGGRATVHQVDALKSQAVHEHLEGLAAQGDQIDLSFNLIGLNDVQGIPLTDLPLADLLEPIQRAVQSHAITARAAARMMKGRGGVILLLTANAGKKPYANTGGFGIACAALEAMGRQMALEWGADEIRVVCLRSAGSPDAPGVAEVFEQHARQAGQRPDDFRAALQARTMLRRLPSLQDIGHLAALVASDYGRCLTAAIINATCGELADS